MVKTCRIRVTLQSFEKVSLKKILSIDSVSIISKIIYTYFRRISCGQAGIEFKREKSGKKIL